MPRLRHSGALISVLFYLTVSTLLPLFYLTLSLYPPSLSPSSEQANVTGRSAKSVREFLEKHYSPEAVKCREDTVLLAIKALLEVVQSGSKSMEVAVIERGKELQVHFYRTKNTTMTCKVNVPLYNMHCMC